MNQVEEAQPKPLGRPTVKRWFVVLGVALCAASWAAFAFGMVIGVGSGTRIALLTAALLISEGLFWLAAALLGVTVFQLRRRLIGALLGRGIRRAD